MALTNGLSLPIPELTDAADGPDAFSDLANAVEDYAYDRILPSGVTRYPTHHWGSGTSFPTTGVMIGDTFTHTGLGCLMVNTAASTWRQVHAAIVANATARAAISTNYPTVLHDGFRVQDTDTGRSFIWIGSDWRLGRPLAPQRFADNPVGATYATPGPTTVHPSRTIDPASIFGAGVGALVIINAHVLLDAVGGVATRWDFSLVKPALSTTKVSVNSRAWTGRGSLGVSYSEIITAGSTASFSTTLDGGSGAAVVSYSDPPSNHAQYIVLPYL